MNDLSRTLMSLFATGFNPRLYVVCMLLGQAMPAERDPNSVREGRRP